jgi:hypothetical protein
LAGRVLQLHDDQRWSATLSQSGRTRSKDFSWDKHVTSLLALAYGLVREQRHWQGNEVHS